MAVICETLGHWRSAESVLALTDLPRFHFLDAAASMRVREACYPMSHVMDQDLKNHPLRVIRRIAETCRYVRCWRWKVLRWCERHHVNYLVGIAQKTRLIAQLSLWQEAAEAMQTLNGKK